MAYRVTRANLSDPGLTSLAGLDADPGDMPVAEAEDDYTLTPSQSYGRSLLNTASEVAFKALVNLEAGTDFIAPAGNASSATVTATGGATARTLADWMQRIDYYVKPAGAGSDSLSAITTAITAAGAGGVVSLIPGQDYELSSNINLNLDDLTFLIPAGASLTLQSGIAQPAFRVNADRCSIIGAGSSVSKIDCVGRSSGITIASGSVGTTLAGFTILDPTTRGFNAQDCFSATDRFIVRDVKVKYTSVGVAAVGMTHIPLLMNVQGTLTNDVQNFEIIDCEVDLTAFTVQQIAEMGYPSSGTPNVVGIRINQSGTGFIKRGIVRGTRVVFPETADRDNWDPATYGHAPDGAGDRRPTCVEIKTTASNGVLRSVQFTNNTAIGGDLGHSFGQLNGMRYSDNHAEGQTTYCAEFASGKRVVGSGNFFDGVNGGIPLSAHTDDVQLPNSTIYGPSSAASAVSFPTAISVASADVVNIEGSTLYAAEASIPIWRIDGQNQTINARNTHWFGEGFASVDAVQVESGTVTDLDLSGATFVNITGYSIDVASGGTVTNLKTIGCTGRNAGAFNNSGTVTNHEQAYNTGISGLS